MALIEQEKYADCIRGLNEIENEFYFEKAYCFYRLHDNEKALEGIWDNIFRNLIHRSNFRSKIQVLLKNPNFVQKFIYWSKKQILFKNPNVVQKLKCWSKI